MVAVQDQTQLSEAKYDIVGLIGDSYPLRWLVHIMPVSGSCSVHCWMDLFIGDVGLPGNSYT